MSTRKRWIGYHVSASGGYMAMGERASALGADTFAFFTRNPRGGAAIRAEEGDAERFRAWAAENSLGPLVAHAPYTLNPCSDKEKVRDFARLAFDEDLRRMELTPGCFYNFHPGSHVGQGTEAGIAAIAALLDQVLWPEMRTTVLLETMAGKGSEVGGSFAELREILDRVALGDKMGVCLDTCHIWDGGYDIENDLDGVLTEFDKVVGLSRLRAVHLNNSKNLLGSRKDRHAKLLEGVMKPETLGRVICHPALAGRPFILETPNDDAGYAAEIAWVRQGWENAGKE
jgi:deoxyribonuclease-4